MYIVNLGLVSTNSRHGVKYLALFLYLAHIWIVCNIYTMCVYIYIYLIMPLPCLSPKLKEKKVHKPTTSTTKQKQTDNILI